MLANLMKTPDGTILQSKHSHDYVQHLDKNGDTYFIDGGLDYVRHSFNTEPATIITITQDSPFEEIRKYLLRGSFDKKGNRIWIPLKDMEVNHLLNCIMYNYQFKEVPKNVTIDKFTKQYIRELNYRIENNMLI